MVVVDTSVLVKWFVHEDFSSEALTLTDALLDERVRGAAPDIAVVELGNALRYKFPAAEVERVTAAIRSVAAIGLKVIASTPGIVAESVRLAYAYELAVYGAVFVALSRDLGYPLVTADDELLARTAKLGTVIHIRDWRPPQAEA